MAKTHALEQSELLTVEKPVSRISWGGIFIGAIATLAFGILLHSLGAAIGLTAINPAAGDWGGATGMWTGIWSLISIVLATFIGGWLAARASTVFFKRDAVSLGIMTWALSFLFMLFFVMTMAQQTVTQIAGAGVAAAGSAAPEIAQQVNPQQLQQQAQQAQPSQAAGATADAGAYAGWWFFASALLAHFAGILGAMAGTPKAARKEAPLETRRTARIQTRETHA